MENKFKISDKVVALTNTPQHVLQQCQPRKKGEVYSVIDTRECDNCGSQMVNVSDSPSEREFLLCHCGGRLATNGVHWTLSINFAPVDEVLAHALEQEEYEYACKLRDA
jgi:protein-arginine kinase activator protein McsA